MKILIIEDDRILSKTVEQCLKGRYDVDSAYDGSEAIDINITIKHFFMALISAEYLFYNYPLGRICRQQS